MAIHRIRDIPDSVLFQTAERVEIIDDSIRQLLDDMLETMHHDQGVGLAGNQIGILKRLVVIDLVEENFMEKPLKMINPEIIWASEKKTKIQGRLLICTRMLRGSRKIR